MTKLITWLKSFFVSKAKQDQLDLEECYKHLLPTGVKWEDYDKVFPGMATRIKFLIKDELNHQKSLNPKGPYVQNTITIIATAFWEQMPFTVNTNTTVH